MTHPQAHELPNWLDRLEQDLTQLQSTDLLRTAKIVDAKSSLELECDGRQYRNFGSNDYLGLTWHPRVIDAVRSHIGQLERWGSGASPMVVGRSQAHDQLERSLARLEDAEAALTFSTGYAANMGVLSALLRPEDVVFSDRLNHASLIDGIRLSGAKKFIYEHLDVDHLRCLLKAERHQGEQAWIITDSIFSMDGDEAPLESLCDLSDRFDANIIVDEAHATGVAGPKGKGLVGKYQLEQRIAIRIGTLSKALGSVGGFVVGPTTAIDWLRNRARSYIYSTAMPAVAAAAACAAIEVSKSMEAERHHLRELSRCLRKQIELQGWRTGQGDSPVVPIYVGTPARAMQLGEQMRSAGFWVPAIRPPTVQLEGSLLRVSLNIHHSQQDMLELVAALKYAYESTRF